MFGIIIATHGEMSKGIVDASNMIFGPQEYLEAVSLNPEDEVESLGKKIQEAYESVNTGNGVVIFTDLVGASPFNQSTLTIHHLPEDEQDNVFVLTGVNLPMVIEAINQNIMNTEIESAVDQIKQSGKDGIEDWSIKSVNLVDEDDDF